MPTAKTTIVVVDVTDLPDGQLLMYDEVAGKLVPSGEVIGGAVTLNQLTDVTLTDPADGHALLFNGSLWLNAALAVSDVTGLQAALDAKLADTSVLNSLADTDVAAPLDNQLLAWNTTSGKWEAVNGSMISGGASVLDELGDATIITPTTSHVLRYNGTAWVNAALVIADITGLQTELDGKSATGHGHTVADTTGLQTELDSKAAAVHGHAISDTTGLQAALDAKAATAHGHAISDTTGLQAVLDSKLDGAHSHGADDLSDVTVTTPAVTEVLRYNGSLWVNAALVIADISGLQTAIDGKSATGHGHAADDLSDVAVTTPAVAEVLRYNGSLWVNAALAIADISGLQAAIDGKSSTSHAHGADDLSDVTITFPAAADFLRYNGSAWVNEALEIADVSGLQDAINDKAAASHAHTTNSLVDVVVTTPASAEVLRYNGSIWVNTPLAMSDISGRKIEIGGFINGTPGDSEKLLTCVVGTGFTLPAGLTGSNAYAEATATGSAAITIQKNGGNIGTIDFAPATAVATFTFAAPVSFVAGDRLQLIAPASADATLGDISCTIIGDI